MSLKRKPRKSLLNGWGPTRNDTKSYSGLTSDSLVSKKASWRAQNSRVLDVPWRTFGLTTPSSWTDRLLILNVGARRIFQSNGLKAASPCVSSIARTKKFVVKY